MADRVLKNGSMAISQHNLNTYILLFILFENENLPTYRHNATLNQARVKVMYLPHKPVLEWRYGISGTGH